jgi:hypothetical protein
MEHHRECGYILNEAASVGLGSSGGGDNISRKKARDGRTFDQQKRAGREEKKKKKKLRNWNMAATPKNVNDYK